MASWVDYIVVASKSSVGDIDVSQIDTNDLISGRKGKLVINPIYRTISRSKDGVHLWRKREDMKWELECLMMMKAMPMQILLYQKVVEDIDANRSSDDVLTLAKRGIILEVPENFI